MSIKKELQAFYAKQGLTGKHLRKALQYDMKAVYAARKAQSVPRRGSLLSQFVWISTPQGAGYWYARSRVNWG